MATETPATAASIESANTAGYRPELRCSVPEYSQDRKFPSASALRSVHSSPTTNLLPALTHFGGRGAGRSEPYICQFPNCNTRLVDKGGLNRHNREVHGPETNYCPITSCKRHVRGFRRKNNRDEHRKRCHPLQSPNLAPPLILGQQNHTSDSMKGQQESYKGGSSSEMVTGGGGRLIETLENLYKMREKIEADIEALKRSLDLLGEDSP